MLTLYCRREGRIVADEMRPGEPIPDGLIWADLMEPTEDDVKLIKAIADIDIPTPEEMREIEPSSRLYREGLALFMTASILHNSDTMSPETRPVTFVLSDGLLTTVRHYPHLPFATFVSRIRAHPQMCANPEMALAELLDSISDRLADTLESVDINVGQLSKKIFSPIDTRGGSTVDYSQELVTIGGNAVRCSKVDESLVSLSRLLVFFDANLRQLNRKEVRMRMKDVQRDLISLLGYEQRLSDKLQLLLDATLGMINIQQNNIIKIFSVVAVMFMPPTLVASIYGMNFQYMPELHSQLGYPYALILIVIAAVLPFVYFRRRGWF